MARLLLAYANHGTLEGTTLKGKRILNKTSIDFIKYYKNTTIYYKGSNSNITLVWIYKYLFDKNETKDLKLFGFKSMNGHGLTA